jgi:hypothetical protein
MSTVKISNLIEEIFGHAAVLEQNGRLRSTVYGIKKSIYIFNQDLTVLMRFPLRDFQFSSPISFRANDYESREFRIEGDQIQFITKQDGYVKVKSCSTPSRTPEEVSTLFKSFWEKKSGDATIIGKEIISLLDDRLSHVEFSAVGGKLQIVQRDIYSGTVSTITKDDKNGFNLGSTKLNDFTPIGMRYGDFLAMYTFSDAVEWCFGNCQAWASNADKRRPMNAVIGLCVYDELGRDEHGRKK